MKVKGLLINNENKKLRYQSTGKYYPILCEKIKEKRFLHNISNNMIAAEQWTSQFTKYFNNFYYKMLQES